MGKIKVEKIMIPKNTCIYCSIVRRQKQIDKQYCEDRRQSGTCYIKMGKTDEYLVRKIK